MAKRSTKKATTPAARLKQAQAREQADRVAARNRRERWTATLGRAWLSRKEIAQGSALSALAERRAQLSFRIVSAAAMAALEGKQTSKNAADEMQRAVKAAARAIRTAP